MKRISFTYTNYKGVTKIRTAIPLRIEYKRTDFHPKLQWIMTAVDVDKGFIRDFALQDCDFTTSTCTEKT